MKFYPPWYLLTDSKHKEFFEVELARELHLSHKLYGLKLKSFAKSSVNDDVAFEVEDGTVVVVDLTYSIENSGAYPFYKKYKSSKLWLEKIRTNFLAERSITNDLTEFGFLVLDLILGYVSIKDFELYVYASEELESELGNDVYLDLISCDFNSSYSVANVLTEWFKKNYGGIQDLRGLVSDNATS